MKIYLLLWGWPPVYKQQKPEKPAARVWHIITFLSAVLQKSAKTEEFLTFPSHSPSLVYWCVKGCSAQTCADMSTTIVMRSCDIIPGHLNAHKRVYEGALSSGYMLLVQLGWQWKSYHAMHKQQQKEVSGGKMHNKCGGCFNCGHVFPCLVI